MKTLPTAFRNDDFDFEQLAREGTVVLLRKSKAGFANISYEVVVIHESKDHLGPRGNLILAAECMPQNEKWGEQGWSYRDKDDAWRKFRGLIASKKGAPCDYPSPRNGFHARKQREMTPLAGPPVLTKLTVLQTMSPGERWERLSSCGPSSHRRTEQPLVHDNHPVGRPTKFVARQAGCCNLSFNQLQEDLFR